MGTPKVRNTSASSVSNRTAGKVRMDTDKHYAFEDRLKQMQAAAEIGEHEDIEGLDGLLDIDISQLSLISRQDVANIIKTLLDLMDIFKFMIEDAYKNGDYESGSMFFDQLMKIIREIRMYAKDLNAEESIARLYLVQQKMKAVLAKKHEVVTHSLMGGDEEQQTKIIIEVPEDIENNIQELLERRTTDWARDNLGDTLIPNNGDDANHGDEQSE